MPIEKDELNSPSFPSIWFLSMASVSLEDWQELPFPLHIPVFYFLIPYDMRSNGPG